MVCLILGRIWSCLAATKRYTEQKISTMLRRLTCRDWFEIEKECTISIATVEVDDSDSSTGLHFSWNSEIESLQSLGMEELLSPLFQISFECRRYIYKHISYNDILSLRLTCRLLKNEVEMTRGLMVEYNESLRDCDWIKDIGVGAMFVYDCTRDISKLIRYPQALRQVAVIGKISERNLNFFLEKCPNVERIGFEVHGDNIFELQRYLGPEKKLQHTLQLPSSLTTVRIRTSVSDDKESSRAIEVITPIIDASQYCQLSRVVFVTTTNNVYTLKQYHLLAQKFLELQASTVKTVNINILSTMPGLVPTPFDLVWGEEEESFSSRILSLLELSLTLDYYFEKWSPIFLNSGGFIRVLQLNIANTKWQYITPLIRHNQVSLRSLLVRNISSSERWSKNLIDVSLLQLCCYLESLCMESRPGLNAVLTGVTYLPQTLKIFRLSKFEVKLQQFLIFLFQLNSLQSMELRLCLKTVSMFQSVLNILTIALKFRVTSITQINVVESSAVMELMELDVDKFMKHLYEMDFLTATKTTANDKTFIKIRDAKQRTKTATASGNFNANHSTFVSVGA